MTEVVRRAETPGKTLVVEALNTSYTCKLIESSLPMPSGAAEFRDVRWPAFEGLVQVLRLKQFGGLY